MSKDLFSRSFVKHLSIFSSRYLRCATLSVCLAAKAARAKGKATDKRATHHWI